MTNPLDQIIELIKKTGDNVIVVDSGGNPRYVVMDFKRYHRIAAGRPEVAGLSEEEMLSKINRDIALWKANNDESVDRFDQIETAIAQAKPVKPVDKTSQNQGLTELFSEENSLNLAKKEDIRENSGETEEKYYFEPID